MQVVHRIVPQNLQTEIASITLKIAEVGNRIG